MKDMEPADELRFYHEWNKELQEKNEKLAAVVEALEDAIVVLKHQAADPLARAPAGADLEAELRDQVQGLQDALYSIKDEHPEVYGTICERIPPPSYCKPDKNTAAGALREPSQEGGGESTAGDRPPVDEACDCAECALASEQQEWLVQNGVVQPQPAAAEPVAWAIRLTTGKLFAWHYDTEENARANLHDDGDVVVPLYAAPAAGEGKLRKAEAAIRVAAKTVCWFDWTDNDKDAAASVDDLRKSLAEYDAVRAALGAAP
jgi:hypothetical protein